MGTPSSPEVVRFPLRGEWVAVRTLAHRIPSHTTEMLGQRYAFDFVRPDQRKGLHLHPAGTLRRPCSAGARATTTDGPARLHRLRRPGRGGRGPGAERARIHLVRELALVVNNMVTFDPPGAAWTRWLGTSSSSREPTPSPCSRTWLREPCRSPQVRWFEP
jgi:hypothetical protein